MMPQGSPTNCTSARWHNRASSSGCSSRPFKNASAEDTSSAAEELSPDAFRHRAADVKVRGLDRESRP